MRISDWSSDVCSSDLEAVVPGQQAALAVENADALADMIQRGAQQVEILPDRLGGLAEHGAGGARAQQIATLGRGHDDASRGRSEEHTSELQSLMRISYAVFCLKKKKITTSYSQ